MTRPRACKNCGGPVHGPKRRTVCSLRCRALLGAAARGRRKQAPGLRVQGGQVRPQDITAEDALDTHAKLEAAIARECAPPWVRHPEPWTDVVVRRGARA